MKRILFLAAAMVVVLACGCATWNFTPSRSAKFVDVDNVYIHVDYAIDKHPHVSRFITSTGLEMEFKSGEKVRVTAPDGSRFVAYRHMSSQGRLFVTDDGKWEYFEEATSCILARLAPDGNGYIKIFEGVVCAQKRPPRDPRGRRLY